MTADGAHRAPLQDQRDGVAVAVALALAAGVGVGAVCTIGSFSVVKSAALIMNVPSRSSTFANQFPFGALPPTVSL